ncbi:pilin [Patescibacteria group bacterium]|nr:pilin [Patescibacteria group bacterium]
MKKRILSLIILTVISAPLTVGAITIENPLGPDTDDFPKLIGKIISFTRNIALAVAPIMIIIAGYFFVTAMGQPEKITTAKKIILWTLIGLIVILSAEVIASSFQSAVK